MDFDYREVIKKDGKKLIFCNLEDLVKQFYNVKTIEEAEPNINGQGEYIIHCPFCKEEGHTKHRLYIKSDLTVGHCFVCGRAYLNVTDKIDVRLRDADFMSQMWKKPLELIKLPDEGEWGLNIYKYDAEDFDQRGYDYLCSRQPFMKDLWKMLGFRFLGSNIVMPFYHGNDLIYYQLRFCGVKHGDKGIRYYFPPISKKPPYIIDYKHEQNPKVIICEGVFDAAALLVMAPDYIPCAILGSDISDYEIDFLRELVPREIKIYMDETKISLRVFEKLRTIIDYCPLSIIKSGGEDPEECLNRKYMTHQELQWIK